MFKSHALPAGAAILLKFNMLWQLCNKFCTSVKIDPITLNPFKAKFVGGKEVKVIVFSIPTFRIFFDAIKYQGNEKMGWLFWSQKNFNSGFPFDHSFVEFLL